MSTLIVELYDALKEAGTSEEKARAAAQALADYQGRFDRLDSELSAIKAEIPHLATKADLEGVRTEIQSVRTEIGKMGMRVMIWNAVIVLASALGIVFAILRATGHV